MDHFACGIHVRSSTIARISEQEFRDGDDELDRKFASESRLLMLEPVRVHVLRARMQD